MNYEKLNIKIEGNLITNIDELILYIDALEYDFNINEYLESLANNIRFANYANKEKLLESIVAKLLIFKLKEEENITNLTTLKTMQTYNQDLQNIKLIQTKKEDNDSQKNIDYIIYTELNQITEVLVCDDQRTLYNYIIDHSKEVISKSALEIIEQLKTYANTPLVFYSKDDINLKETMASKNDEVKIIEEYIKNLEIEGDIKVGIDPFGECLYKIGHLIIKFTKEADMHKMMVLTSPKEEKHTRELVELDNNQEDILSTPTFDIKVVNLEEFKKLILDRDVYDIELSKEETSRVHAYVNLLLAGMYTRALNKELETDAQLSLDDYISKLRDKYNETLESDALSLIEQEELARYDKILKDILTQGLKSKNLIPKLENKNNNGITNVVLLLEITTLGMLLLTILSIAS